MPHYLEFEVSLRYIKPRIWRRFQLPASASFAVLNNAIQDSFGWGDDHLWEFEETGRERKLIAAPREAGGYPLDFGVPAPNAAKVKISEFFLGKSKPPRCIYIYDMGDNWEHEVKLRREFSDPERFRRRLIAGERACPPEDCGGVGGYESMVEFLQTGESSWGEDPDEMREWFGDYDPEGFDLEGVKHKFER